MSVMGASHERAPETVNESKRCERIGDGIEVFAPRIRGGQVCPGTFRDA